MADPRGAGRAIPASIFLSEAFTRPKVMKALAKLGFTQSYTYFTWRTDQGRSCSAYLHELTQYPDARIFPAEFLRQHARTSSLSTCRAASRGCSRSRVALAATLSSNYGIYNGFELLEHEPIPGKEEYLNSEKYEIKVRDWNKPGNIKDYIGRLNRLRRENPALLQTARSALCRRSTTTRSSASSRSRSRATTRSRCAIALSGHGPREFWFHFGDLEIGPSDARRRVSAVENLVTGERHPIEWGGVRLRIDPAYDPALLFRCHA